MWIIPEGIVGLVEIRVRWRNVNKHKGFRISTKGVTHKHGQLMISVWDVMFFRRQCTDNIS